jgi:hypothetical protein
MVEFTLIVIGSYLISGVMVHAVYRWFPRLREPVRHYVLVTRNNERQAEFVIRAITWLSKLRGTSARITVVDECSRDQTIPIIERLDREGHMRVVKTRNWLETEVWLRDMKRTERMAGDRDGQNRTIAEDRHNSRHGKQEKVTVIYLNRLDGRWKEPLFDI